MKVHINKKTYNLDMSLDMFERLERVKEILAEETTFAGDTMSNEDFLSYTYGKSDKSRESAEYLGYYLTKESVKDGVLSRDSIKEMKRGSSRITPFSSMSGKEKIEVNDMSWDSNSKRV